MDRVQLENRETLLDSVMKATVKATLVQKIGKLNLRSMTSARADAATG